MKDPLLFETPCRSHVNILEEMVTPSMKGTSPNKALDWTPIEVDFGFALPPSFKNLSSRVPAGFLGSGITWTSPVAKIDGFHFDRQAAETYAELLAETGTLPIYPVLPGYLVFAATSLRIDMAFWVERDASGLAICHPWVHLIECISGEIEETDTEIDEFLYRAITDTPPLEGALSGRFHEWFFSDPFFRYFSALRTAKMAPGNDSACLHDSDNSPSPPYL